MNYRFAPYIDPDNRTRPGQSDSPITRWPRTHPSLPAASASAGNAIDRLSRSDLLVLAGDLW